MHKARSQYVTTTAHQDQLGKHQSLGQFLLFNMLDRWKPALVTCSPWLLTARVPSVLVKDMSEKTLVAIAEITSGLMDFQVYMTQL